MKITTNAAKILYNCFDHIIENKESNIHQVYKMKTLLEMRERFGEIVYKNMETIDET